jgi:hypothetical protein
MKYLLLTLLLMGYSFVSKAQTAEDSVKLTVNKLFDGMKASDGAMIKAAFSDSAILQSIGRDKSGKMAVVNELIADFADFMSKQPKGAADERITYDVIKIDGQLAIVWAPYKFYFNGVFSHCGVDSFQLVKIGNEWRIQYLIDTRRRTGCE